jgi:hypothetical protein
MIIHIKMKYSHRVRKYPEQHDYHLKLINEQLKKYNLKVKLPKCEFGVEKIDFIGHVISHGLMEPDKRNAQNLADKPKPKTEKEIRSFLGLANYYRNFIKNFAQIAQPLYDLLSDTKDKVWDGYCDQAYEDLKCMLTGETVLTLPNFDHPFELCTDACDTGIGAVLQQTIDGATRPVGYFSKHLNPTMQKYSTPEKELLAIFLAVEHFHYYFYGNKWFFGFFITPDISMFL